MKSRKDNSKAENRVIRDIDFGNRKPTFRYKRSSTCVVKRDENGKMVEVQKCTSKK